MKRKAATLLVIFMMLLVCLSLLSRAVSCVGIANVRVATASSQTITHRMSVEGVLVSDGASGYTLEAAVPAGAGAGILGRDVAATVTLADGARIDGLSLSSGLSEDGSQVLVQAVMPEDGGTYVDGSRAQVEIVLASTGYLKCLPAESIYLEGSRSYVYVVTEVSSLTGTELGVQKVYVAVLDSDQVIVALDDSSVTREQMVVVRSDRVISEDTRVRITE
jgi:hypothetical protein